jgi:hypothetical protein
MTSDTGADRPSWRIPRRSAVELITWAWKVAAKDLSLAVRVAEFVAEQVLVDPDFGEEMDDHTRRDTVPGTQVVVLWTFDPVNHSVEILEPPYP